MAYTLSFVTVILCLTTKLGTSTPVAPQSSVHSVATKSIFTGIKNSEVDEEVTIKNVPSGSLHVSLSSPTWFQDWEAPAEMIRWFPYYIAGRDYEGSPVFVFEFGHWNLMEALHKSPGGRRKLRELYTLYVEKMILTMLRVGKANGDQGIGCIVDYDGFSFSKLAERTAMELFLQLFTHLNRVHTVMNYAFLVNTNFGAENLLRLAKPFMGSILEKSEIYGPQKARWIPSVLRKISKTELPLWYGGADDWRPVWIGGTAFNSSLFENSAFY